MLAFPAGTVRASSPQEGRSTPEKGYDPSVFTFYFRPADILLLPNYRGNRRQLQRLASSIGKLRRERTLKDHYFRIISSLEPGTEADPEAINLASLQGSVIKSYLYTHYRLADMDFTFGIDTCGGQNGRTMLAILPQPVPDGANTAIHYSLSKTAAGARTAVKSYGQIPYVCGERTTSCTTVSENRVPDDALPSGQTGTVCRCDSLNKILDDLRSEVCTAERSARSYADSLYRTGIALSALYAQKVVTTEYRPVIGIKTNLLYWAGFFPDMTWKQVLPNLSLEFFFADRWSVAVDGAASLRLRNGRDQKLCAFSSFGGEGRYWFRKGGLYKGFYAGIYLNGGTFDRSPKHTEDLGHTGTFVGVGLSAGYTYMFNQWLGLEIGIRGCFRHVEDDRYQHVDPNYFYRSTEYKNGVRLGGVFLNLTGRFGKYK